MKILKICDICGTVNFSDSNFCFHCGNKIVPENICPFCNCQNDDFNIICINCGNTIRPVAINSFDELFSEYNFYLFSKFEISDYEYIYLLKSIFKKMDYLQHNHDSPKSQILKLASLFTECRQKSRGYERGFSLANVIYYDDRLDESLQIATIIHELSHYLLFHIIELLLCKIFNVKSSSTLQSFVWYVLTFEEVAIMNEYCAHTVEGRFLPYGYQNYGSFNKLVEESQNIDEDNLKKAIVIGNSFANEIISFLEKYIDNELRNSIKFQYKYDSDDVSNKSLSYETEISLELSVKNQLLLKKLFELFKQASNEENRKELGLIKEGLENY